MIEDILGYFGPLCKAHSSKLDSFMYQGPFVPKKIDGHKSSEYYIPCNHWPVVATPPLLGTKARPGGWWLFAALPTGL